MHPMKAMGRHSRGFSLVEALVAMMFMSLLMAGMLKVFAGSTKSFSAARERTVAQRANRWALGVMEDDLQAAGFFFPMRPVPGYISVAAGQQNPVMVLPNNTITVKTRQPAGALVAENLTVDELQVLTDIPLGVSAQLAAVPTGPGTITLTVNSGNLTDVLPGDFMLLMDSDYEKAQVTSVSGNTVTLDLTAAAQNPITGEATGISPGLKNLNHQPGAQVFFVRPNMVIRYSIQPDASDPADPLAQVPVLVREMAPYPTTGALLDWSTMTPATPGYLRQIVSSNCAGLRVDMSADGGANWSRSSAGGAGTAGWAQMVAQVNAKLATNPAPNNSITNIANPLWYRTIPMLFRIDLQTRSSNLRTEASTMDNALAFNTRTQVLFVSPRNFTLGN